MHWFKIGLKSDNRLFRIRFCSLAFWKVVYRNSLEAEKRVKNANESVGHEAPSFWRAGARAACCQETWRHPPIWQSSCGHPSQSPAQQARLQLKQKQFLTKQHSRLRSRHYSFIESGIDQHKRKVWLGSYGIVGILPPLCLYALTKTLILYCCYCLISSHMRHCCHLLLNSVFRIDDQLDTYSTLDLGVIQGPYGLQPHC